MDVKPRVYNIPAGTPFADALCTALLERTKGQPEKLAAMHILLPTRRACKNVRDTFLRLTDGHPLLLPQLQPLGDVDEEELMLNLAGFDDDKFSNLEFDLPPAMPPLRRQILLARAIIAQNKDSDIRQSPDHAMALAHALGQLLDKIYTEDLVLSDLPSLVTGEFAAHWEITLNFLTILSQKWPEILSSFGMIDAADRRNRLLNKMADYWQEFPPQTDIIAAGSTGSIPAAARLLSVIARLPRGCVVLPGFDDNLDDESWQALDDTHPQACLKKTLSHIGIKRTDVQPWISGKDIMGRSDIEARRKLAREMMRPAATTSQWITLQSQDTAPYKASLKNIQRINCSTPDQEAQIIALLLRETLETPEKTAALVTPDRNLARRVTMACLRWGIGLDDSGGRMLSDTLLGSFLRLSAQSCLDEFSPVGLLSLLRHNLCNLDLRRRDLNEAINLLEITALRGTKPAPGLKGLRTIIEKEGKETELETLLGSFETACLCFTDLLEPAERRPYQKWLRAHIEMAENIARTATQEGADILWANEQGHVGSSFLSELNEHAFALPDVNAAEYLAILEQLMKSTMVRPTYGTHPRLAILGQLESRLLQTDLVILSGLNEGTWPDNPGHEPWMSRPMMEAYGLPSPEAMIGLSAHDFAQCFCGPEVVLTRSERADGTPQLPARWLQRLDTVLQALKIDPDILNEKQAYYKNLLTQLTVNENIKSCKRPAPTPPVKLRPRRLSVTKIENWLRDPYSIYARYVLKLRKLKEIEKMPDAAERGEFLHDVLDKFIVTHKSDLPGNSRDILLGMGQDLLTQRTDDPGFWDFWWPRFERIADWFVNHEARWRSEAKPLDTEAIGAFTFKTTAGDFTLSARADRIDILKDGSLAAIDYKSGGVYSAKNIRNGILPQLPLEALILTEGGFENIPAAAPTYLGYWILTGGRNAGETKYLKETLCETIETTRTGLMNLINIFDDENTPYYSLPDPDRAPRFNDYEHLARVQEWVALGDSDTDGGGA